MLQISVVDSSAEERLRTLQWLEQIFEGEVEGAEFAPRVSFRPVSISEIKFQNIPDIVIIGPSLSSGPTDDLSHIKKAVAHVPVVVVTKNSRISLATVEYLSRIGIEEIVSRDIEPQELIRRFVMLTSKLRRSESGSLVVVESAKGGVGATSIIAGLGELIAESGKKTLLVDMDSERQALSRFLQARPFINEPLQAILDSHRPLSNDFVQQCIIQVWGDLPNFYCMPPCVQGVLDGTLSTQLARILINLFEMLDINHDIVIVDASQATGTLRRILHRAADTVLFVTEGDPASVYASFDKLKRIREEMSPDARLRIVQNCSRLRAAGLSRVELQREFERVVGTVDSEWIQVTIPYSARSSRWPGSGLTSYSAGTHHIQKAFRSMRNELLNIPADESFIKRLSQNLKSFKQYVLRKQVNCSEQNPNLQTCSRAILNEYNTKKNLTGEAHVRQIDWQAGISDQQRLIDNFITPPL
jgi:cellulose biosynthesis protein BcsQ